MRQEYRNKVNEKSFNDTFGNECIRLKDLFEIGDSFNLTTEQMMSIGGLHQLDKDLFIKLTSIEKTIIIEALKNGMSILAPKGVNERIQQIINKVEKL